VHLLQTMGKAAELYLPNLMRMFVQMLGSTAEQLEQMRFPQELAQRPPRAHTDK